MKALRWSMVLTLVPCGGMIACLPLAPNRFRKAVCRRMDRVIGAAIERCRSGVERGDLVSALVDGRQTGDGGGGLNDDEIRDELYVMLLAGYESSADTLAWCFWHLNAWPEARERVEREVDRVLGGRRPVADDYWRLEYLQAVVNETLRLTPPGVCGGAQGFAGLRDRAVDSAEGYNGAADVAGGAARRGLFR